MTLDSTAAIAHIRRGRIITLVGLAALLAVYYLALVWTPLERNQGAVQKIYYIHPPAAYAMQLAFLLTGLASVVFLLIKDVRMDLFAEASAEVGLVLSAIVLTTGPIWGKGAWGVWWNWDPRLTFTLIEALVFAGYFAVRSAVEDPQERARLSAVVGVMALVLVPFNHLTVYLFPSLHPEPIALRAGKPALPPEMLRTFLAAFAVFTVIYLGLVMQRYGIGVRRAIKEEVDA